MTLHERKDSNALSSTPQARLRRRSLGDHRARALALLAMAALLAGCATVEPLARPGVAVPISGQAAPPPVAPAWRGLIGEYAAERDRVIVLEAGGRLQARIGERSFPLEPAAEADTFHLREVAHDGAALAFERAADGRAQALRLDGVRHARIAQGPDDGSPFRIVPLRAVEELRAAARMATPPAERGPFRASELVELSTLDPTIRLDIRYASNDNFLGVPLYTQPRAFLQRPAAQALVRASHWLAGHGYGVVVYDGYRPWYVTKMFWDATPDAQKIFVADPAKGSRHNRGCAVDLSLYELASGVPVEMTGGYDEMTARSYPDYPGGTARQRWHRDLLRHAMEAQGFSVYETEWWHFDYVDWPHYAIGTAAFEEL